MNRGPAGPIGPAGSKGDKGDLGPQGLQGLVGPRGSQGDTGPQGLKGDTGLQGIQGPKGDTGQIGPQGTQGPVGFNASNSLLERVSVLEQYFASFVQQKQQAQQSNGSLLTGFAPSPGVTVIGNSTFVFGDAVFLGSPTTTTVTENGDDWVPNVLMVNVGDNVTWAWVSTTSLVEVNAVNNAQVLSGGVTSGRQR